MEPVAKWIDGFVVLPTTAPAIEWVGVAVLICAATAAWTALRGSRPDWRGPSVRTGGLAALGCILFGIWIGISVSLLFGALVLGAGCCISLWSLLMRFGVGWREHIRPGMLPFLFTLFFAFGLWYAPRITLFGAVVLGLWARQTLRSAIHSTDRQLSDLSTRALALTNHEAASYLTTAWFQRFAPHASNLMLLTLASEARSRTYAFPRARRIVQASDALLRLAGFAEDALDQRLRTDRAASRTSSWVRVMTREFFRQFFHRTGLVALFSLVSDLVLAVPPAKQETWADRIRDGRVEAPDWQGYVVALIADMPAAVHQGEIDLLRDRISRDADAFGPEWLTLVATRAECLREEVPNPDRDVRLEIVAEVLWGVYESALGPRPVRYHLYDQVRLQTPEMVQRSSVRKVHVEADCLVMQLEGVPRAFDELGTGNPVIVQTPDDITWSFRRLETIDSGVVLIFSPLTPGHVPTTLEADARPARERTKEITTALAAAASQ